jgi:uncharacterized protein (DUF2235 family)
MAKHIIVCSDGTGNTAIKDRGTNVFKLFEAVDVNGHRTDPNLIPQVTIYDDGVGTESFVPLAILGGAFGWGMKRNVLKLYTSLVRIYDPGDRIYLFGFSRGAFTVRTLAGLIAKCGILDDARLETTDAMRKAVAAAYSAYRQGYRTWLWRVLHGKNEVDVRNAADAATARFRTGQQAHDAEIHFIGVWDTVDSVGGPFHIADAINTLIHRFKLPDYKLNATIRWAVHAVSIDDARSAFVPRLWEADARVEQVCFAGVHANVGGGYPKQGMSLVTLDWMLQKAAERDLRVIPEERRSYLAHSNVDDKLYDSRSGLSVFYQWKPRDMKDLWDRQKAGLIPSIHLSVLERIAHGTDGYAPGTLAPAVRVVYTPTGDPDQDKTAAIRVEAVNQVVNRVLGGNGAHLNKVGGTLVLGQVSYLLYVASCLAVILAASIPHNADGRLNPGIVLRNALRLVYEVVTLQWNSLWAAAQRLWAGSDLLMTLLAGFLISGALAYYVDSRRSLSYSRFWHDARQDLRSALKDARLRAQQELDSPGLSRNTHDADSGLPPHSLGRK